MNQTLNQDEIDSLLGNPNEQNNVQGTDDLAAPHAYDLANNDKNIYSRVATLGLVNERFARNIRITINSFLKRNVEVTLQGLKIIKYEEYVNSLYIPTSINIVKIAPLKGTALIVLDSKLVFALVDNYFGGEGKVNYKIEGREFTETENRITRMLVEGFFADFKEAWKGILDVQLEYKGFEANPAMANFMNLSELLIVSKFHFELDGGGGDFNICIPYSMLEPIRELLNAGIKPEKEVSDEKWIQKIREEILEAQVQAHCILTNKKISLRDVMRFKNGDVLDIEIPEEIVLKVSNIPMFTGNFGTFEGKYAVKIVDKLKKPPKR
ncbi:MAG: flagellar motor switch protein FliM [Candidatus Berkiella sp.]